LYSSDPQTADAAHHVAPVASLGWPVSGRPTLAEGASCLSEGVCDAASVQTFILRVQRSQPQISCQQGSAGRHPSSSHDDDGPHRVGGRRHVEERRQPGSPVPLQSRRRVCRPGTGAGSSRDGSHAPRGSAAIPPPTYRERRRGFLTPVSILWRTSRFTRAASTPSYSARNAATASRS